MLKLLAYIELQLYATMPNSKTKELLHKLKILQQKKNITIKK